MKSKTQGIALFKRLMLNIFVNVSVWILISYLNSSFRNSAARYTILRTISHEKTRTVFHAKSSSRFQRRLSKFRGHSFNLRLKHAMYASSRRSAVSDDVACKVHEFIYPGCPGRTITLNTFSALKR